MPYLDLGSSSQAWVLAPTPRIALDAPIAPLARLTADGVEQFNDYALNLVWPAIPASKRPLLWLRALVKRWVLRW